MFSPVGNLPPSIYWRRRLFVVGAGILLVLLIVLTINVALGGGGDEQQVAGSETSRSSTPSTTGVASTPSGSTPATSTSPTPAGSTPGSTAGSAGGGTSTAVVPPSSVAPVACVARDLAVQAAVGQSTYKVGERPVVSMQVTNVGTKPCVQDLADKQIVLRLYNGESRVWGSHDCEIQPGTNARTLLVRQPVRVSITWSGSTSQEGCKGARQRVGAGTYTLYASLAGKAGKAASFTIT